MIHSAFDGQVEFDCRFRTNGTDRRASRLYQAIKEHLPDLDESSRGTASLATFMLACSRSVTFHLSAEAPEELTALRDFWTWYSAHIINADGHFIVDDEALAKVWLRWDEEVGNEVQREWYKGYKNAQTRYAAVKDIAHPSTLSTVEAEDDELKKRESQGVSESVTAPKK